MKPEERTFLEAVKQGKYIVDIQNGTIYSCKYRRFIGSRHTAGYISIGSGGGKTLLVHRLIYLCSGRDIPDGYEINHKNGNKPENRIDNLECVTRSENTLHAHHILGKIFGVFERDNTGTHNGRAKLDWSKVRQIRILYATGRYTQPQLAGYFGIGKSQISNIILGLHWKE